MNVCFTVVESYLKYLEKIECLLTCNKSHLNHGREDKKSTILKRFSSWRTTLQATQKPPLELGRMLSGKHGKLSANTVHWRASIPFKLYLQHTTFKWYDLTINTNLQQRQLETNDVLRISDKNKNKRAAKDSLLVTLIPNLSHRTNVKRHGLNDPSRGSCHKTKMRNKNIITTAARRQHHLLLQRPLRYDSILARPTPSHKTKTKKVTCQTVGQAGAPQNIILRSQVNIMLKCESASTTKQPAADKWPCRSANQQTRLYLIHTREAVRLTTAFNCTTGLLNSSSIPSFTICWILAQYGAIRNCRSHWRMPTQSLNSKNSFRAIPYAVCQWDRDRTTMWRFDCINVQTSHGAKSFVMVTYVMLLLSRQINNVCNSLTHWNGHLYFLLYRLNANVC